MPTCGCSPSWKQVGASSRRQACRGSGRSIRGLWCLRRRESEVHSAARHVPPVSMEFCRFGDARAATSAVHLAPALRFHPDDGNSPALYQSSNGSCARRTRSSHGDAACPSSCRSKLRHRKFPVAANSAATFAVGSGYTGHASRKVVPRELFGKDSPPRSGGGD